MIERSSPSYPVTIFIAGDYQEAKSACQNYCDLVGLCVTVSKIHYIFTNGDEKGVAVGLINYPRFPSTPEEITARAIELGDLLRERLRQQSYSVQTPTITIWRSWREQ
jgi:hypothetical protein